MSERQAPYLVKQVFADDADAVLSILEYHQGQENAITSRALARTLCMSTRRVRQVIAGLVKAGHLIGATVDGETGGYFLIETEEELEATRAILRARAGAIFERDRDLCRAWNVQHGKELQPLLPMLEVA